MKKSILLGLLVVVLALAAMSVVFAAEDVAVNPDYFVCGSFFAENAKIYAFEDGTVSVVFDAGPPTVLLDHVQTERLKKNNAIQIVMANNSACNQLEVSCTYMSADGSVEITETEYLTIERKSGKKAYYIYPSHMEHLTEMRLAFLGGYSGSLQFYSVDAVSLYNDSVEQAGTISDCVYDSKKSVVRISGTVSHDIAIDTRNATVELYAFGMDETITARKVGYATPLATKPLTTRFEFEVPVTFFSDRFLQYVVAIMSPEGRVLHLFSPQFPCTPPSEEIVSPDFKGIYTDRTTLASRADPQIAIVDVYLDRMQSEGSTGLLHVVDGRYYYIDRAYVYELDDLVKYYSGAGCRVYFRLLLSGEGGYHLLHSGNAEPMEVNHRGLYISGEASRFLLFAYTEFLCRRYYSPDAMVGFIVGRGVNNSAENNYVGNPSLERYTSIYTTALYLISEAARGDGRKVDIIVPLTDDFGGYEVRSDTVGKYSPEIFLVSLCKRLESLYGEGLTFRLMIEDRCETDSPELLLNSTFTHSFESVEKDLADTYGRIEEGYLHYWIPHEMSAETVPHIYTYMYYKSFFSTAAAFILSTEELDENVEWESLFETVKYIDTNKGIGRSAETLTLLGVEQWTALIPSFNLLSLARRQAYIYETYDEPPFRAMGSYVMWDHQQGRSIYDWSLKTEGSLAVSDVKAMGRALVATLMPDEKQIGYSELVYAYSASEVMSVVDMLSIDLMVLGQEGGTYKLIFEISGDTSTAEVTAYLQHGIKSTVYLNTLDLDRSEHIRSIRIFSTPVEGEESYSLCIERLAAHSTTLEDEALEEAVKTARLEALAGVGKEQGKADSFSNAMKAFLLVLAVGISVVILVALSRRSEEQ